MSRRKGEVTGHMNEREFPHLVELELAPGGYRSQNLEAIPILSRSSSAPG